jgi:hypothetical protein
MTIHEDLASAWSTRGLHVVACDALSGNSHRPNPTLVTLAAGNGQTSSFYLFAWRTTHEGKGRKNDNLRIQGTNFGNTNSPYTINRSTVAIGYSEPHNVFFGFDAWIKRQPGKSSSVHIKRHLIEEAQRTGLAFGGDSWDPRIAFTAAHAEELLPWVGRLWDRKQISVKVLSTKPIDKDNQVVRVDPRSSRAANAVRPKDRLALFNANGKGSPDQYLWRVRQIKVVPVQLASGSNRYHYDFTVEVSAKVKGDVEAP